MQRSANQFYRQAWVSVQENKLCKFGKWQIWIIVVLEMNEKNQNHSQ